MTPDMLKAMAEIAAWPVVQTLILRGHYEAASRFIAAKDGDAIPLSAEEWESLNTSPPYRECQWPQGIVREPPAELVITKR